jgi:hypothetical protein
LQGDITNSIYHPATYSANDVSATVLAEVSEVTNCGADSKDSKDKLECVNKPFGPFAKHRNSRLMRPDEG